jgi:DNA-binding SARP family transcriptional activator
MLLKLLALQPRHRLHGEQVMELLWPELDAESATNNLHKTIHIVRHGSRFRVNGQAGGVRTNVGHRCRTD